MKRKKKRQINAQCQMNELTENTWKLGIVQQKGVSKQQKAETK